MEYGSCLEHPMLWLTEPITLVFLRYAQAMLSLEQCLRLDALAPYAMPP